MILVLILYMLFASTFTLGKMALNYCDPLFFIAVRMLVGGGLLLGYYSIFDRTQWNIQKKDLNLFIQLILFHIFLAFTLEFWALQYVSGAKAALIYNFSPFMTAAFAYLLFSERLSMIKGISLIIGFVGLIPILIAKTGNLLAIYSFFDIAMPDLALFGAVACSAYGWIVMKQLLAKDYSIILSNGIAMVGGGVLAGITSLLFEGIPHIKMPEHLDTLSRWALSIFGVYAPLLLFSFFMLIMILIANIICYNLYAALLKRFSVTFIAFCGFITPLFTALYDWLFLGQVITWHFVVSFIVIFIGIVMYFYGETA